MRDSKWVVSPATRVSWRHGRIEIASLRTGAIFQSDDPGILQVIHIFASATPIADAVRALMDVPAEDVSRCVDALIDGGVLIEDSNRGGDEDDGWDPTALAFHRSSRAVSRREKALPDEQLVTASAPLGTVALPPPVQHEMRPFPELLQSRCSTRMWPSRSISLQAFSDFLGMSAGDRPSATGPLDHASRSYPSGGALYSIECYPVLSMSAVEGMSAGVYRYRPRSHTLEVLSVQTIASVPILEAAGRSAGSHPPPVVLVITSRFAMPSAAYGVLAYSLVLKEVGALFQTFYLVAEHLGLAACALGGGTPDILFARLSSTAELAEPIVGEFMLGPR